MHFKSLFPLIVSVNSITQAVLIISLSVTTRVVYKAGLPPFLSHDINKQDTCLKNCRVTVAQTNYLLDSFGNEYIYCTMYIMYYVHGIRDDHVKISTSGSRLAQGACNCIVGFLLDSFKIKSLKVIFFYVIFEWRPIRKQYFYKLTRLL